MIQWVTPGATPSFHTLDMPAPVLRKQEEGIMNLLGVSGQICLCEDAGVQKGCEDEMMVS